MITRDTTIHGVVARGSLEMTALACRESEARRSMRTDTTCQESVVLDRDARMLKEAFSRCRRDVSVPQTDERVRNLVKAIGSGRVKTAEHVIVIAWDAFNREAPQDDVEAFGHIYIAIVRSWYAARRRGESLDLRDLIRHAVQAHGEAAVAEVACLSERTPKALADAEEALTHEEIEIEALLERLRELRYASVAA